MRSKWFLWLIAMLIGTALALPPVAFTAEPAEKKEELKEKIKEKREEMKEKSGKQGAEEVLREEEGKKGGAKGKEEGKATGNEREEKRKDRGNEREKEGETRGVQGEERGSKGKKGELRTQKRSGRDRSLSDPVVPKPCVLSPCYSILQDSFAKLISCALRRSSTPFKERGTSSELLRSLSALQAATCVVSGAIRLILRGSPRAGIGL